MKEKDLKREINKRCEALTKFVSANGRQHSYPTCVYYDGEKCTLNYCMRKNTRVIPATFHDPEPCPFCGQVPPLNQKGAMSNKWIISCMNTTCENFSLFTADTLNDAIAKWNEYCTRMRGDNNG